MSFRIELDVSARESFGDYRYHIYDGDRLVARYWHDYRGDEHGIEFADESRESWPVGRVVDFIEGGGPTPLVLSARALTYLAGKQAK
ncbi:hypothetical protein R82526_01541 [Ralstonia mannitolilytica]|uniref:hypothetical protein n=1 Tax=Ralstonia mannitolilytica TaxID=105219 RepID=UPI0028F626E6|nr:hypothetical protein [Ralstonia mannitolilytica]CAJ0682051.1 hypothetical protein R82526_01541 [Ralstonia mannitolilytica]